MLLSFVIPCYNSSKTVESVISEIIDKVSEKAEYDYEIIAVNDCSTDNVYDVLCKLAKNNPKIKVINFAKNVGKHGGIMAAYSFIKGDYVIGVDDDGQCPVDKLWRLLAPLDEGYDVSIAKYPRKKESFLKQLGSKANDLMVRTLLDKPKNFVFTNFIARKRFVCDEMIKYTNPYPYLEGLSLRTTRNVAFVPMEERERLAGKSGYTLSKSLKLWFNGLTAFSVKPLRISSLLGIVCSIIGFGYGIFTIINKLIHPHIQAGYTSVIALMLFMGGLVMMILGMIGEYVGRMYICMNNAPQYVIRNKINLDE